MKERRVERFKKRTVWLHWIHTAAFLVLVVTGAFLFFLGIGEPAIGGGTRLAHRIAVVIFVLIPLLYAVFNPRMTWHFIKETFTWGNDDFGWMQAAPLYYFGGPEENMPPQGHVNTGQKLWQLVVLLTGVLFLASGFVMMFLKGTVAPALFQWSVFVHDIAFLVAFLMLLVHVYLGIIHPRMTESLRSMWDGKVSEEYARNHYSRWYNEGASRKK